MQTIVGILTFTSRIQAEYIFSCSAVSCSCSCCRILRRSLVSYICSKSYTARYDRERITSNRCVKMLQSSSVDGVMLHSCADTEGGGGGGGRVRTPLENHKNIGLLSSTGPDPLKIRKLPSQLSMLGHHRYASETPFKWRFAGVPIPQTRLEFQVQIE